jgi:hypothetical protein
MKHLLFFSIASLVVFVQACISFGHTGTKQTQNISATSSSGLVSDIEKIIRLADAFKASLSSEQLAQVQLAYSKTDAMKWSNFPASFRNAQRVGLSFGTMTADQVTLAKTLLKVVSGTIPHDGYEELQEIINADDYLRSNGSGPEYGAANYYLAFLGTPATTGTFEIQFGGHHLAFANTYTNGILTGATPSFRGVEPFGAFGDNNEPLNGEQAAFAALLAGLSTQELEVAKLDRTFGDILLGPRRDAAFPANPSGLKCGNLTAVQKDLVLKAIETYVKDIDGNSASAIMAKYTRELNDTYIAYSGTTSMANRNDYVRIDGPSVWIEWSMQGGVIMRGNHPHSVWRDKKNDYGGN